jgi:hypothetical protein
MIFLIFDSNRRLGMCCADVELRLPISAKIRRFPLLSVLLQSRHVILIRSSVSTNLGDMANPGVGSAVYDKITNVVTWKAEKVAAGTEALIRITMMQGSEEPLSINVQVGTFVFAAPFPVFQSYYFYRFLEYL